MESFIEYLLNEGVKLTPAELIKPNSATREKRTDILRREIKTGNPLELVSGKKFLVTDIRSALAAIDQFERDQKPFLLIGKNGEVASSSDLKKNVVFGGGGGGSGGGSAQTKDAESAQCVWLQAMLDHGPNYGVDYFTDDILRAAYRKCDVDAKIDDILKLPQEWIASSYLGAQYILTQGYVKKSMKLHRGSSLMKGIYHAKDVAFKNNDMPKFSDDKWNPGDIWAADSSFRLSDLPTDSVRSLNKKILELFTQRRLVGISLKKLVKRVTSTEYNVQIPPDVDDYRVMEVALESKRGSFWSSKGGVIVYDDGVMNIRDNSYMGAIIVEIIGKNARGGGAAWGPIMDAAESTIKRRLPTLTQIKQSAIKIHRGDAKEIRDMYDVVKTLYNNLSQTEFNAELAKKDAGWIYAKLGAAHLAAMIQSNMGAKANRFVTKLVNYAGSKSEDSSAYVKIY